MSDVRYIDPNVIVERAADGAELIICAAGPGKDQITLTHEDGRVEIVERPFKPCPGEATPGSVPPA